MFWPKVINDFATLIWSTCKSEYLLLDENSFELLIYTLLIIWVPYILMFIRTSVSSRQPMRMLINIYVLETD